MRKILFLAILLALVAPAPTKAQTRPEPKTSAGGLVDVSNILTGISLLRRSDVRAELKFTAVQAAKYNTNGPLLRKRVRSKQEAAQVRAAANAVKTMLSKKQQDRLKQLYYQAQGTFALGNDAIANKVGLSKRQKKQIVDIRMEGLRKFDAERKREGKAFKPDLATTNWIMTSIEKLLTPPQRKIWLSMLGKPFAFNPPLRS